MSLQLITEAIQIKTEVIEDIKSHQLDLRLYTRKKCRHGISKDCKKCQILKSCLRKKCQNDCSDAICEHNVWKCLCDECPLFKD